MAVSGSQLTRFGQYFAGTGKKLTITAKTAAPVIEGARIRLFIQNFNRMGRR